MTLKPTHGPPNSFPLRRRPAALKMINQTQDGVEFVIDFRVASNDRCPTFGAALTFDQIEAFACRHKRRTIPFVRSDVRVSGRAIFGLADSDGGSKSDWRLERLMSEKASKQKETLKRALWCLQDKLELVAGSDAEFDRGQRNSGQRCGDEIKTTAKGIVQTSAGRRNVLSGVDNVTRYYGDPLQRCTLHKVRSYTHPYMGARHLSKDQG